MALRFQLCVWSALLVAGVAVGCQSQSPPSRSERVTEPGERSARDDSKPRPAPPRFTFEGDDVAFLAEVEQAIPIGTSIDEAERILKANGFKCERHDGSEGKPGLSARRSKQSTFITSWVWVLWLVEEDGKVNGITGSTAGLGP